MPIRRATAGVLILAVVACGPTRVNLPAGPGAPLPGYADLLQRATAECRGVRSLTAELRLSGRAGRQNVRGRVLAGVSAPASLRLEGVAPFGSPVFILAADGGQATLLLPRDNRVLRGEPPEAVLDALVGVTIAPADFLAVLSGCLRASAQPTGGRDYGRAAAVDLSDGTLWLMKRADTWRLWAGTWNGLTIDYAGDSGPRPAQVHIRTEPGGGAGDTDIVLRLSQIETDVTLGPEAFTVDVPADAQPIGIDELRQNGPLGGRDHQS